MAEKQGKKAPKSAASAVVGEGPSASPATSAGRSSRPARDAAIPMRSMPQDLGAEAAVLGSMIIDPRCVGEVIETLSRNAFYHSEHQILFDAVISLYEKNRGEGIDGLLVRNELERRNQLDAIGGAEYLQRVIESVPSSASVQYYADIVREKMLLRETIIAATEILTD
ncbi:MAG TPA: DnaB-like helicase N-terminal domain-containing protein, partial [Sedimentisphaerales bacterium]|nr:DnaB-like helicase N-terminal domain-containing protein [Sedimentisphaerales bacterium]